MASADDAIRAHLAEEQGAIVKTAPEPVAWVYPSPYRVGMSSLGYQTLYRSINEQPSRAAHRAFLPDVIGSKRTPLRTYEADRPVGDYPIVAFSVAYEMEIAGMIQCMELAGMSALTEERADTDPFVLAGGPLTFSNPLPLAPFVDAIIMGEADEVVHTVLDIVFASDTKAEAIEALASTPGVYVPSHHGDDMPGIAKAADEGLPAFSQIVTPNTELRNMFLIEPERGCHRGCEYCVMRRSTNDGMRTVPIERILSLVPEYAPRVGLVGAATTDHPQITQIVESLVERGLEVGLSSLRADRLNARFVRALRAAGQTVLTTASDGASQRLRSLIQRRAPENVLQGAAELAREHGMKRVKLYMMLGLPTETDEDIDELIAFSTKLSKVIPLALGIAPFVAKRNTPLDGAPFAGTEVVDRRLKRLRRGVKGRVEIRATSARWAWIEYVLAQGGRAEGRAVLDAVRGGGNFGAWKRAFDGLPKNRPTRQLVRPGNKLGRALDVVP